MRMGPEATLEEPLLDQLRGAFGALAESVRGLDVATLDATMAPDTNSIAVLVTHSIQTARAILHDVLGQPSPRDRDAAFQVSGRTSGDLLTELSTWSTEMDDLVARALAEPLERQIERYRTATIAWWLLQVLGHTREHAAHAALTRQLLADTVRPSRP